ncbi:MAG: hypothetical protein D6E12_04955 [Desulfovibrio sp.]|nr:MAG: hypothetical protein D6E12_04955 [Desulfovibrio sp.]
MRSLIRILLPIVLIAVLCPVPAPCEDPQWIDLGMTGDSIFSMYLDGSSILWENENQALVKWKLVLRHPTREEMDDPQAVTTLVWTMRYDCSANLEMELMGQGYNYAGREVGYFEQPGEWQPLRDDHRIPFMYVCNRYYE